MFITCPAPSLSISIFSVLKQGIRPWQMCWLQHQQPTTYKNKRLCITMDIEVSRLVQRKVNMTDTDEFQRRFVTSLQELNDLHSQLHLAADCCEKAFAKSTQKKMVMEGTKDYICKAMVTVVDHLGTVSANIESLLDSGARLSDSEFRLHCLNQKLVKWNEYSSKVDLPRVHHTTNTWRHHKRYIAPSIPSLERCNAFVISRDSDSTTSNETSSKLEDMLKAEQLPNITDQSLHVNKPVIRSMGAKRFNFSTLLPVRNEPLAMAKLDPNYPCIQSLAKHYRQAEHSAKGANKPMQNIKFVALLRRSKRASETTETYKQLGLATSSDKEWNGISSLRDVCHIFAWINIISVFFGSEQNYWNISIW